MRLLWLPDVLTVAGCRVEVYPGWRDRGRDLDTVKGLVWHHTASSPKSSDATVEQLLTVGRPDLTGPLCQLGLRRDGTFVVIASGRANHNGYGVWGNDAIGIEAYNNGIGEPWPAAQLDAWVVGSAAILRHLELDVSQMRGHRETDPKRKIDPTGIDMDNARQLVAAHMRLQTQPPQPPDPEPEPIPHMEDPDMPYLLRAKASPTDGLWLIDGDNAVAVPSETSFAYARDNSPGLPTITLDVPTARRFLTTKKAITK